MEDSSNRLMVISGSMAKDSRLFDFRLESFGSSYFFPLEPPYPLPVLGIRNIAIC